MNGCKSSIWGGWWVVLRINRCKSQNGALLMCIRHKVAHFVFYAGLAMDWHKQYSVFKRSTTHLCVDNCYLLLAPALGVITVQQLTKIWCCLACAVCWHRSTLASIGPLLSSCCACMNHLAQTSGLAACLPHEGLQARLYHCKNLSSVRLC